MTFFESKKCTVAEKKIEKHSSSSSSFEGYPLQVRHKQDWGRGFILLLPQTAALPGLDAGSDVVTPHRVSTSKTVSCYFFNMLP